MILDTNALSAFLGKQPQIRAVLERANGCFLPTIVIGEYRYGLLFSNRRVELEAGLEELLPDATVLPVDIGTTHCYASIRMELKKAGTPIPENDVWIAAISRQHDLPLLSRDSHFDTVRGLSRISW